MKRMILLVIIFTTTFSYSQEGKIYRADKNFDKYDFVDAQKIYQKVADKGYESADLFKKLADSYYLNAKYADAQTYYEKLIKQFPENADAETYFRYTQSLKAAQEYDLADTMMLRFVELNQKDKRATLYKNTPDYLGDIKYQKDSYEVFTTTINSGYSDFGPALYKDKLIFASNRDTGVFRKRLHKWNGQPFLDLYKIDLSKVDVDAGFEYAEKFSSSINTPQHESTPTFTNDGKTMYFTRNNVDYKKSKNSTNKLKIYKANLIDGKWTSGESLPFNDDSYATAHPALSVDNKKLFFASDMPGTVGLSDLWYVTINEDGTYGDPVNLGGGINTEGRESFPFISSENDLFFASNGHPGLGGLDLFVTTINAEAVIGEIINLGEPANTPKDDFAFVIDADLNIGFFSSNRNNEGIDDDIYMIKQIKRPTPPCDIVLSGIITEKATGALLGGTKVTLYDVDKHVIASVITVADASYMFTPDCDKTYIVRAENGDFDTAEKIITTPNASAIIEEPIQLEKSLEFIKPGVDIGRVLDLEPIYFDFDESSIRIDAEVELAKILAFMESDPNVKIDVRSHTDSKGPASYNLALSNRRNVATRKWLVAKGIDVSRLSGKGYGESQPINGCSDDVPCTEEQDQLNRRSEFIILEKN